MRWSWAFALIVGLGCATPVGVTRVDPQVVQRALVGNVLSTGEPSATTMQVLERLNLRAVFDEDPGAALGELHRGLAATDDDDRLLALAELSFLRGENEKKPEQYLACAVFAWALLFPGPGEATTFDPSDPRLRLAFDLYNRGLTEGLERTGKGNDIVLRGGDYALPWGTLSIDAPADGFQWAGYQLDSFVASADYQVRGLRNRYRHPGIGAALIASIGADVAQAQAPRGHWRIPEGLKIPVTALLRLDGARAAILGGSLRGRLEVFSQDDAADVEIEGRRVPLEFETTSALAATLEAAPIWQFELRGFLSGVLRPVALLVQGDPAVEGERPEDGLQLLHPYRPGRIPLVLVHGTASSSARWTELVNELENDPRIWQRYQIWLFLYNTGNPVGWSASILRRALESTVQELDPNGRDPALREMVVVGHSQGGLLTKLTAVDSGDAFWSGVSSKPFDSLTMDDDDRALLRGMLFFEPEPFVKRVVFIATPHRGSYLAGFSVARFLGGFVTLPTSLVQATFDLASRNEGHLAIRAIDRLPTSIDNMTPGNPFLQTLAQLPVAPGIAANSIVAVRGSGPIEGGSDGVVDYSSAHLEGVESEKIVRGGHSTQSHPDTIEEVRRILLKHAGVE